jgi:3-dehydroquinate dehydratase type I
MLEDSVDVGQLIERVAQKKPDLVEFRLDKLRNPGMLETVAQKKTFPAIATDKSIRDPPAAEKLLLGAAIAGFEYVDIDLASPFAKTAISRAKFHGAEVIISFHDFSKTPPAIELNKVLNSARKVGGDLCKIVTTALQPRDNLAILGFLEKRAAETRLVAFAMGSQGVPSRILSPLFGAEFAFAALSEETRTAEGQLSIDSLRNVWQLLGVQ